MSIRELKCVENFIVEGHFGKLEWLNPVDLVNLDVDKVRILKILQFYLKFMLILVLFSVSKLDNSNRRLVHLSLS